MNFRAPGPLCDELTAWTHDVSDGTSSRTASPTPSAVGGDTSVATRVLSQFVATLCGPSAVAKAVKKARGASTQATANAPAAAAPAPAKAAAPEKPAAHIGVAHVLLAPESYIGNDAFANAKGNHECVEFARQVGGAPQTALWKPGTHVAPGAGLQKGTWVATFVNNRYEGHVGAFDTIDEQGNLTLFDQWNSKGKVSRTTYHVKNKGYAGRISNDPSKYYVVLW